MSAAVATKCITCDHQKDRHGEDQQGGYCFDCVDTEPRQARCSRYVDAETRATSERVCSACGAIEKDTSPCYGWNYADAHLIHNGATPDYCGPFEPQTDA